MGKSSVLVIAAHADDEVLGCGGTIALHAHQGDDVRVLLFTDGIGARGIISPNDVEDRKVAAREAACLLGVRDVFFKSYADNRMDDAGLLDIVRDIEAVTSVYAPDVIYTHHGGDVNIDHSRVHEAVLAACRPQPGGALKLLLFFETPSSTEWRPAASSPAFSPNWYNDISQTLQLKMSALACYHQELREFPHPRSLVAVGHLAAWRGATVGVEAAEAFELGWMINSHKKSIS